MDKIIDLKDKINEKIMEDAEIQMVTDLIKELELLDIMEDSIIKLNDIGMNTITLNTDFVLNLINQNQEYIDSLIEGYFKGE